MIGWLARGTGNTLTVIPLMIFPMLVYMFIPQVEVTLFERVMPSGSVTYFTAADAITCFAIVMLALEMIKSTSTGARGISDLVLSVFLLCGSMGWYLLMPGFGTSTFLILVLMQGLDVIAGTVVSVKVARRDIGLT